MEPAVALVESQAARWSDGQVGLRRERLRTPSSDQGYPSLWPRPRELGSCRDHQPAQGPTHQQARSAGRRRWVELSRRARERGSPLGMATGAPATTSRRDPSSEPAVSMTEGWVAWQEGRVRATSADACAGRPVANSMRAGSRTAVDVEVTRGDFMHVDFGRSQEFEHWHRNTRPGHSRLGDGDG